MKLHRKSRSWNAAVFVCLTLFTCAEAQCPWSLELVDLHTDCICAYNSAQRLSIQCTPVNFIKLMAALNKSVMGTPIDTLYINNSTVPTLEDSVFKDLEIKKLQLSRSNVRTISPSAFSGLERHLVTLNLNGNQLTSVPSEAIRKLRSLKELDLSHNKIQLVLDGAFMGVPLTTLELADNPLNISEGAFRGLESTLRSLNLKGSEISKVPTAIGSLNLLSFLDLAQNKIADIQDGVFENLHSLTALSLERNRLVRINSSAFRGVNDTISNLSLLNNLLLEFPVRVIAALKELRVLDLGFNGIRSVPDDAFRHNSMLTLLALDGNPLPTLSLEAFRHLNSTLRGLSVGGSYLECDCRLRWLSEWASTNNLHVSSRERNPQYCGKPASLRKRKFPQISPDELVCGDSTPSVPPTPAVSRTTKTPKRLEDFDISQKVTKEGKKTSTDASVVKASLGISRTPSTTTPKISRSDITHSNQQQAELEEVTIVDAYRKDGTILVEWNSESSNLLGFQVAYRKFGEAEFKKSPALPKTQRKFTLENMPNAECVVVCVVTLEESPTLSADSVSYRQCRELKKDATSKPLEVDKIVIGASAAICCLIIVVVLILVCCFRKKGNNNNNTKLPPPPPAIKSEHEWETSSMYSSRSIPRAHMYHVEPTANGSVNHSFVVDDNRSHLSHYSQMPNGYTKSRPTADGQSHRSYPSNRFNGSHPLGNPELRKSQQSLSQLSGHHSFIGSNMSMPHPKKKERLTSASSLHSLSEYNSDWNDRANWKDQEVDIYVGQNGAMPNHAKYRKSYGGR